MSNNTTGRIARWLEQLRAFTSQFQMVREVLTFTLFASGAIFWWTRDEQQVIPYVTAIVIAHVVCLAILGVARMKYGPPN